MSTLSAWRRMLSVVIVCWLSGSLSGFASAQDRQDAFKLPPPADSAEALRRAFYAYDSDLPLNAVVKPLMKAVLKSTAQSSVTAPSKAGVKPKAGTAVNVMVKDESEIRTRYRLDYDSAHDQRVSAIVAVPKKVKGPMPAVLLMHGSGGDKDVNYIHGISEALVRRGFITLSIDAQYRGDRVKPGRVNDIKPDSYTWRDAWVQTVIDLRRAVDYLETRPDVDKSRIGYLGVSMGGILGGILGGVEERVSCFALVVPGGGFVELAKNVESYPNLKAHWPIKVTPEVLKRVEDIANVADPIYFVGRILPRPLLIIVAKHDELIPPAASAAFVAASHADEATQVRRVESGHVPPTQVVFEVRDYFVNQLGKK